MTLRLQVGEDNFIKLCVLIICKFHLTAQLVFLHFMFPKAKAAKLAVKAGVDAIIVSCHGGRQLPGVQPPVSLANHRDQS